MSKKVTLKTVENILKEIEIAAHDDYRVISDIKNKTVREIVERSSEVTIKKNVAGIALGAGGAAAVGAAGAGAILGGGAAAGGAAAGGAILGGGAAAGGATIMGIGGGAAAGGAAGAAAGSVVPIVGTIIGAAAGLGIGIVTGLVIGKHQENKKEFCNQEIEKKQNAEINILNKKREQLENELYEKTAENAELQAYAEAVTNEKEELKAKLKQEIKKNKKLSEKAREIDDIIARLKYLIGILTAFGDIKGLLECTPA